MEVYVTSSLSCVPRPLAGEHPHPWGRGNPPRGKGQIIAAIVTNLIRGQIFFWVDRFIFTTPALPTQWEVRENIACADCGKIARGYRIETTENYNK